MYPEGFLQSSSVHAKGEVTILQPSNTTQKKRGRASKAQKYLKAWTSVTAAHLGGATPLCASLGEVDPVVPAIDAEAVIGHAEFCTIVLIAPVPCAFVQISHARASLHFT